MSNNIRGVVETFREWYRKNRSLMKVGMILASGKDGREIESLENQQNTPRITKQISPNDMSVEHNIVQTEKEASADEMKVRDCQKDKNQIMKELSQNNGEISANELTDIQQLIDMDELTILNSGLGNGNTILTLLLKNIDNPEVVDFIKNNLKKGGSSAELVQLWICTYFYENKFPSEEELRQFVMSGSNDKIQELEKKFSNYFELLQSMGVRVGLGHLKEIMELLGTVNISIFDVCMNIFRCLNIRAISYLISKEGYGSNAKCFIDKCPSNKKNYILTVLLDAYLKQYRSNPDKMDTYIFNRFIVLAEENDCQELKELITKGILDKSFTNNESLFQESDRMVDELDSGVVLDEDFNEQIELLEETLLASVKYQYLIDFYIKCMNTMYSKNPQLAITTIKIIMASVKRDKIKEVVCDKETFIEEHPGVAFNANSYSDKFKTIILNSRQLSIGILFHETGHLLHDMLDSMQVPDADIFSKLMVSIRENLDSRNILEQIAKTTQELQEDAKGKMHKKVAEDGFISSLFGDFEFDKILSSLNLPPEYVEYIRNNSSEEIKTQYLNSFKETIVDEMTCIYMRTNYAWIGAICDIIDAIYEGSFEKNFDVYGHGEAYYKGDVDIRFGEIFANYYQICALDPEKKEMLGELLGNEFIQYMDQYFEEKVGTYEFDAETK